MLDFVLYRSRALKPLNGNDDQRILMRSRSNNQRRSLTGFLWRGRTHYLQYFEGPSISCEELLVQLDRDPRHDRMRVLARGRCQVRRYAHWSMGFEHVTKSNASNGRDSGLAASVLFPGLLNAEQVLDFLDDHASVVRPLPPRTALSEGLVG